MKPGIDYIGVGVGVVLFNENNKIFLMRRGPKSKNECGAWALPGGKVEFNETLINAAIRETKEEFDIAITITKHLTTYDHIIPNEKQHWITNIFCATIVSGTPIIQEPEKCDQIGWFTLTELPSPIAKMTQQAIDNLL
jgi:mutator protein MutT